MTNGAELLIHPGETAESFIATNLAASSLHERFGLNFPSPSTWPETEGPTTLRFIFWVHNADNTANIIPLLEGCDVLAREAVSNQVSTNIVERQRQERDETFRQDMLSALITRDVDPKVVNRLRRRDVDAGAFAELSEEKRVSMIHDLAEDYEAHVLTHLAGRVDGYYLVDARHEHTERLTSLERASREKVHEFVDALDEATTSWSQLREYALDFLRASGREDEFRERITARQLESIARAHPGKRIAVLYGTGHSLLTRLVKTPGVGLQQHFAEVDVETREHPYGITAVQLALINSLRADVYNPSHLDQFIAHTLAADLKDEKLKEASGKLTPEQLSSVATQLSKLWEEPIESYYYEDEPEFTALVNQRRQQTAAIFKKATAAHRLPRLLKRKS